MEGTPTFIIGDETYSGAEAAKRWKKQLARCNCGSYGHASKKIYGTCGNADAIWLGCPNCKGQAIGRPLLYR